MPHPIADVAREAFAAGWAVSEGPMTDRVRAGCVAAVAMAVEHADDPQILEVTLKLGQLEGTWATVYERRERLIQQHTKTVTKAWRAIVGDFDLRRLITRFRADQFMPTEAADPLLTIRRNEAKQAALGYLNGIHNADEYDTLRDAVADAFRSARAEGWTSGKHIHAERAPREATDTWSGDFTNYYNQLGLLDDWPALADKWIGTLVGSASTDLGNLLASMSRDVASYEDMLAAASDLLDSANVRAVSTLLDYAMSDAITQGSVDLYASEGVASYDILTASDSRVCKRCLDAEANNPYPITSSPAIPSHPMCVVGSTRITAPDLVGVVPGDEPDRLALDPAHATVALGGEVGAASAATMTESAFDFGRRNIRAVTVREFVGEVVTIRVASGEELTATPNHPIATPGGWVPIAELTVGDYVLRSTWPEWGVSPVDPDVNDVPPRIEDVAETFPVTFGPMPTAAEDFHGDGADSDVHVVRTDGLLVNDFPASVAEHPGKCQFGRGDVAVGTPLIGESDLAPHLERVLLPSDRVMGGAGEPGAFLGAGLRHPHVHRVTPAARFDPSIEQGFANGGSADSEGFCERLLAFSADITADKIADIRRHPFAGHVYNLETVGGWYIGNSIVTHNCRCAVVPSISAIKQFAPIYPEV